MWKELKKCNFSELDLRYINQDILENFFSETRDVGHRNNNPTPCNFAGAFKSRLIYNITSKHSPSANCEETHSGVSMSLMNLFHASEKISNERETEVQCIKNISDEEAKYTESAENICVNINVQNIIHSNQHKVQCEKCVNIINNGDFVNMLQHRISTLEKEMTLLCNEIQIKKKIINILSKNIKRSCPHHEIIYDIMAEEFFMEWARYVNKLLNGTIKETNRNFLFLQAQECATKYTRNKKRYNNQKHNYYIFHIVFFHGYGNYCIVFL